MGNETKRHVLRVAIFLPLCTSHGVCVNSDVLSGDPRLVHDCRALAVRPLITVSWWLRLESPEEVLRYLITWVVGTRRGGGDTFENQLVIIGKRLQLPLVFL
jgi:hypothetical protein